ncbi:MAG: biotin--[acetyl-CoA-carboxylase] ligase [Deltaproteobacteria bacterium]|nr:biotin--[acetyl-CoA-carboxylase] ligase [Deltaproteobacteria bacterium]
MKLTPRTKWLGHEIFFFKSTNSTNTQAKEWLKKNPHFEKGIVFIADEQTEGRGRYKRTWFSPPETNLYLSILLKEETIPQNLPQITFPISLAVYETCQKEIDGVGLKWPNDVLIHNKKVAGILLEREKNGLVVGIGLNVNQKEFPKDLKTLATSLSLQTKKDLNRENVLHTLLEKTEQWYDYYLKNGFQPIKELWLGKSLIKGKKARIQSGEIVTLIDLYEDGSLIYEEKNKTRGRLFSGDEICYLS